MRFDNPSLKHTNMPDPLWLYKMGIALLCREADSKSVSEKTAVEDILGTIHACLESPEIIRHTHTALEPLIHALSQEAIALDDAFDLFPRPKGDYRQRQDYIRDVVAEQVLQVFTNAAALVHLQRVGKISERELLYGAALETRKLNQFGSNGLDAFLHEWELQNVDLLAKLKANQKSFRPDRLRNYNNTRDEVMTRAKYFEIEMNYAKPKTAEAEDKLINEIIPRAIGPEYAKASRARNDLVGFYLTSGTNKPNHDFWVRIAATHRNYDRAQRMVEPDPTDGLLFNDPRLNVSAEELQRIAAGDAPKGFNEYVDHQLGAQRAELEQIPGNLRKAIAAHERKEHVVPEKTEEPPPKDQKALLAPEDTQETEARKNIAAPRKPEREDDEPAKSGKLSMGIKAGGTILGGILVVDQLHRARKERNVPDSTTSKRDEKHSKVVHYVVAAVASVGVGMLFFTKPDKLVQFVDSLPDIFKGGARKA